MLELETEVALQRMILYFIVSLPTFLNEFGRVRETPKMGSLREQTFTPLGEEAWQG